MLHLLFSLEVRPSSFQKEFSGVTFWVSFCSVFLFTWLLSNCYLCFVCFILDDGTLEGVLHDLRTVENITGELGLQLNCAKCVVIYSDPETLGKFICGSLGLQVVNPEVATLLGSPIGGMEGIKALITTKINCLKFMDSQFRHLLTHDAFSLLQNQFAIQKLVYSLWFFLFFLQ